MKKDDPELSPFILSKDKGALVPWSGGLDSTALLVSLALLNPDFEVRAISFNHDQITSSSSQSQRRGVLRELFRREGVRNIEFSEVSLVSNGFSVSHTDGLPQLALWLSLTTTYLREGDDLYMAYVRLDDFWHKSAWAHQVFSGLQGVAGGRSGNFLYPFEHIFKGEIRLALGSFSPSILSSTISCEYPADLGLPCGDCDSCITEKTSIYRDSLRPPDMEFSVCPLLRFLHSFGSHPHHSGREIVSGL